jgi:hypothetical protein
MKLLNIFGIYTRDQLPPGWIIQQNDLNQYKAYTENDCSKPCYTYTKTYRTISGAIGEAIKYHRLVEIMKKKNNWRQV